MSTNYLSIITFLLILIIIVFMAVIYTYLKNRIDDTLPKDSTDMLLEDFQSFMTDRIGQEFEFGLPTRFLTLTFHGFGEFDTKLDPEGFIVNDSSHLVTIHSINITENEFSRDKYYRFYHKSDFSYYHTGNFISTAATFVSGSPNIGTLSYIEFLF